MTIRDAALADLDKVCLLLSEANPFEDLRRLKDRIRAAVSEDGSSIDVFFRYIGGPSCPEAAIFAYAERCSSPIVMLEDLAVASTFRRRGHGSALVRALLAWKPGASIMGEVHWKNAEAIPFYYRLGFRMETVHRSAFGDGEDAVEIVLGMADMQSAQNSVRELCAMECDEVDEDCKARGDAGGSAAALTCSARIRSGGKR